MSDLLRLYQIYRKLINEYVTEWYGYGKKICKKVKWRQLPKCYVACLNFLVIIRSNGSQFSFIAKFISIKFYEL